MYLGLYQGAAAMTGLERWQNHISQNIANSGVAGYKSTDLQLEGKRINPEASGGTFGKLLMDTMVGSQPAINLSQGQVIASDSPLDVAIDGAGFFQIQQPDGSHLYTRNGQFHINSDNQLVNQSNLPVLGDTGPIQLIPGGGEISIDISGRIFQGTTPVATLKVTEFQNPDNLELHAGGFMIKPGENAGPQDAENPRVLQGYYEASNVNPVTEMVKLIAVSRAYEANQKVIQNQDRMLERATSAFSPQ